MKKIILFVTVITSVFASQTAQAQQNAASLPYAQFTNHRWVDSVFNSLSVDEKIAQLIAVPAYSNRDEAHKQEIVKLIREQKIGGLVFMQGGPVREARLINEYQAVSKVPLLMAM